MKVCQVCGETYSNHVDFCFVDGDVLVAQASVFDVPEPKVMAAQGAQRAAPSRVEQSAPVDEDPDHTLTGDYSASGAAAQADSNLSPVEAPPLSYPPVADVTGTGTSPTLIPTPDREELASEVPVAADNAPPAPVPPAPVPPGPVPPAAEVDTQVPKAPVVGMGDQNTEVYPRAQSSSNEATQPPASQVSTVTPLDSQPQISMVGESDGNGNNKMLVFGLIGVIALAFFAGVVVLGTGLLSSGAKSPPTQIIEPKVAAGTPAAQTANIAPAPAPEALPAPDVAPAPELAPAPEVAPVVEEPAPVAEEIKPDVPPEPVVDAGNDGVAVAEIAPEPQVKVGAVSLSSVPSGLTLTVDGEDKGVTPQTVSLPYGDHEVVISGEGTEHRQTIKVNAAEVSVPPVMLSPPEPPAGTEALSPEPELVEAPAPAAAGRVGAVMVFYSGRSGDELIIDGTVAGALPVRYELSEGNHSFTITGSAGEVKVSKMIKLKPDGQITLIHLK